MKPIEQLLLKHKLLGDQFSNDPMFSLFFTTLEDELLNRKLTYTVDTQCGEQVIITHDTNKIILIYFSKNRIYVSRYINYRNTLTIILGIHELSLKEIINDILISIYENKPLTYP
jgi:hypothetical protein